MSKHLYAFDARTATDHFPGIGRYAFHLARALDALLRDDERLAVLYAPSPSAWKLAVCPNEWRAASCVPVSASPFSLSQQWRLPRLLHTLGAHVYHSTYYLMPYRPGRPTVLTVYDVIPLRFPATVSRRARLLFRLTLALALRAADAVLCISKATARDVQALFSVPEERIHVTPLAADAYFRPVASQEREALVNRLGLPDRYVLYVGSNKPHKNLERLVRAWALVCPDDVTLVIAGPWLPAHSAPRALAARLGLDGRQVRFLGPVPERDLPALYSGALGFVFPSLYEGFGLPVLEAMACGTPVACSRAGSLPEVAGEAALYFDPTDVTDIASTVQLLLEDENVRASLRSAGLARAAHFTWERTASQTLTAYRQLAAL